ncbi:hypothetical protein [Sinorhizobium meliloti]|uniref:hypothetical protein n=1 Tax=Rhizobium meliloti TaxID=382 RepID=UPI000FE11326|nr:hypothetical protein [Sinorhizobium meliloti]MDX0469930.1 hypothetical protein [Sinorhizobium medicae]MDX1177070.1 hypothetical protein [Sinorhizobium medicae]MDX1250268.1 hypothetical protein [Sinorhizobium medicae]RVL63500.1 hypothetical protein CN141_06400 [Sinorhizobium meliloti]
MAEALRISAPRETSLIEKLGRLNNEAWEHVGGDPILAAIKAYRDGMGAYNAAPGEDAETVRRTYGIPHQVLEDWTLPAQTREGALEALRLAVEEERDCGASYLTLPLMTAALGYFEKDSKRGLQV